MLGPLGMKRRCRAAQRQDALESLAFPPPWPPVLELRAAEITAPIARAASLRGELAGVHHRRTTRPVTSWAGVRLRIAELEFARRATRLGGPGHEGWSVSDHTTVSDFAIEYIQFVGNALQPAL